MLAMEECVELTPRNAHEAAAEAVKFVREQFHLELDYSPQSLRNLDDVLEDFRNSGRTSHELGGGATCFGCYLGEVLIRNLGGQWRGREEVGFQQTASPIVLAFSVEMACNPLGKVCKRIDNGAEDSLTSFYRMLQPNVLRPVREMQLAAAPRSPAGTPGLASSENPAPRAVVNDLSSDARPLDWPTTPGADGRGVALVTVMAAPGPEAAQAGYLVRAAAELQRQGWEPVEFQTVAQGSSGLFTIPCALRKENAFAIVFSHFGLWTRPDFQRFRGWYDKVRACDQTRRIPIIVVTDKEPILLQALGMVGERYGVFVERVTEA
jgi:hypothetical protein